MYSYRHHIVLDRGNLGHAYLSGMIDELSFYVVLHKSVFKNALNFRTHDLGEGTVERLMLYTESTDFEGNPFTPSMTIKRNVYAEFHEGWIIFNPSYESYVQDLMHYIQMRSTFKTL